MKRLLVITSIALIILLVAPLGVKAATGGEVDLYQMVADLLFRIGQQEEEMERMQARINELEQQLNQEPTEPTEEPITEPEENPDPVPPQEPEPEPEPEPNRYSHLKLEDVYVSMSNYKAAFAKWRIDINEELDDKQRMLYSEYMLGKVHVATEKELEFHEKKLEQIGITDYTITELHVDPLFYEIVEGKTFGSRSDVLAYLDAVINDKPFKPTNKEDWHYQDPHYYLNWKK